MQPVRAVRYATWCSSAVFAQFSGHATKSKIELHLETTSWPIAGASLNFIEERLTRSVAGRFDDRSNVLHSTLAQHSRGTSVFSSRGSRVCSRAWPGARAF